MDGRNVAPGLTVWFSTSIAAPRVVIAASCIFLTTRTKAKRSAHHAVGRLRLSGMVV
ncbi:hypothetical protein B0G69_4138 [Paraburkholderia sp. RAU2J]|nr:hypothetical protein B0G69_4138 [Paraburkholderia sp. RAU2J]